VGCSLRAGVMPPQHCAPYMRANGLVSLFPDMVMKAIVFGIESDCLNSHGF